MRHKIIESLPVAGIIAFSGCSVNALAHWLLAWSLHPTQWYWVAALLVECCTAWLVWSIVDTLRTLTRSNISKQDRRFYRIILTGFVSLSVPSLTASVVANFVEFRGNLLLAILFPVLSVACAVGAGLPDVIQRYKERQAQDKTDREKRQREAEERKVAVLVRQEPEPVQSDNDNIPPLTKKADRLTWLIGQMPDNAPEIADMMAAWQVSERTVRRYLSKAKDNPLYFIRGELVDEAPEM